MYAVEQSVETPAEHVLQPGYMYLMKTSNED